MVNWTNEKDRRVLGSDDVAGNRKMDFQMYLLVMLNFDLKSFFFFQL